MIAVIIQPNAQPVKVEGEFGSLDALQEVVGGYIEVAPHIFGSNVTMYVNEEGIIHDLSLNQEASRLCQTSIVGPAIILGCNEDGEDIDVPEQVLSYLGLN